MFQIDETNLQFASPCIPRQSTKRIIFHHSAGESGDAYAFHQQHLGQGWKGIGYHFVILQDGRIQRGRPIDTIGSHSGPTGNGDSIGVCVVGNFDNHPPADIQVQAAIWLIQQVEAVYGNLEVDGHREFMQTACPGGQFPDPNYLEQIAEGGTPTMTDDQRLNAPIESWEIERLQKAKEMQFLADSHEPREVVTMSEFAAGMLNFYTKLTGTKV